jgi:hypothetical protein
MRLALAALLAAVSCGLNPSVQRERRKKRMDKKTDPLFFDMINLVEIMMLSPSGYN